MEIIVAVTVGLLVTIGIWMLLDRGLLRVVLGIVVLGNGVNLAVFSAGRLDGRAAAFVTEGGAPALAANPLPQALVLTAIVIGFALFVFALAVLKRSFELHGNVETDRITAVAEEPAPDLPAPAKSVTPTSGDSAAMQAAGTSRAPGALPATPPSAAKAERHGAAAGGHA
ncbi:Na(+)/H(+) antiporter subunit C [Thauera sp. GDN1]|uniref:sodium:proton antiporter n=1 Tax=Thauera sp. GDN1 TaxID=2944810 RepID=UPI00247A696F|nr:sodium:proton antiporter [Thauera sp. GDN1]WEN41173.1 Na(+)/H(+) antiporter subunit C [Thauera sp. GDN1]